MKSNEEVKVPTHLVVTVLFSSILTAVVSLIYVALSSVALALRLQCNFMNPENLTGSDFFISIIYRVYILHDDDCDNKITHAGLTESDTVFILMVFTLVVSLLTLVAAIALLIVITDEGLVAKYINIFVYTYLGTYVASFIVELTFAIFLGLDYGFLSEQLDRSSVGLNMNYLTDTIRLGAFFLMTLSLKGFLYPVVNITLLVLMVKYTVDYQNLLQKNEHPIHKMGALDAYEQQRRQEDPWQPQPDMFLGLSRTRSHHSNHGFIHDDDLSPLPPPPRSPMREPSISDYSNNRFFDRPESWQARSAQSGSRPFSYLGDTNRPMASKPPPVPAPDYSPPTARRLKSALKPAYM